jgi:hypothetical protein
MLSGTVSFAQTEITKRYEVSGNQAIQFQFDDASIINITGWQENYISIDASISINNNQQNEAYQFEESMINGEKQIVGYLNDKKNLPRVIQIKKGDELFTFNTDDWNSPEILKFYEEHGEEGISWKSYGISWVINLKIKIPQNSNVTVSSKHGIIELENILGKVDANSIHGGIDLSVNEKSKCSLNAKTKWGTIYSNLNLKVDKELSSSRDWNNVIASINGGSGPSIKLESRHANIYLRNK